MKRKDLNATVSLFSVALFLILCNTNDPRLFLAAVFMVLCRAAVMIREMPGILYDPELREQVIRRNEFWGVFCVKLFFELLPFALALIAFFFLIKRKHVWLPFVTMP